MRLALRPGYFALLPRKQLVTDRPQRYRQGHESRKTAATRERRMAVATGVPLRVKPAGPRRRSGKRSRRSKRRLRNPRQVKSALVAYLATRNHRSVNFERSGELTPHASSTGQAGLSPRRVIRSGPF
jgi:hypothetical protein